MNPVVCGLAVLGILSSAGCMESPPPADARASTDAPRLRREGPWLVDPLGRVVLVHGMNLIWKTAPHVPPDTPAGFTAADARWLAQHGFNGARIGTLWAGVMPREAGEVDPAYLEQWDRVVRLLAAQRIWMLFDFHQDQMSPQFQGEGLPPPQFGFPFNYFTPQVSELFDKLWAERGPVWDGFRDAWTAVAARWKDQPYHMGYDLLNEPWSGQEWPSCIFPPAVGCPDADRDEIQPFMEHGLAGVRRADPHNLVWFEPQLLSGGTGAPTGFVPVAGEFRYRYTPRAAGGPTEIFVPLAMHYPKGYRVEVQGARVVSAADAPALLLENLAGAAEVSVALAPL